MKPVNQKAWWLVAPVFLCVAFSAVLPLMTVVNYSVQDIISPERRVFVGTEWFAAVMRDSDLHEACGPWIARVLPLEEHTARETSAGQRRAVGVRRALDAGDAARPFENLRLTLDDGSRRQALADEIEGQHGNLGRIEAVITKLREARRQNQTN